MVGHIFKTFHQEHNVRSLVMTASCYDTLEIVGIIIIIIIWLTNLKNISEMT